MKRNHVTQIDDSVTMLRGVLRAADLAARSYGPRAGAVIASRGGKVIWSRDGVGLLRGLRGGTAGERVGLELCRSIASDLHLAHGDGAKTSLIMFGSLLRSGLRSNVSRAEARDFLSSALSKLPLTAEPASEDLLKSLALRACEGDGELAEAVYGAVDRAGELGAVRIVPGRTVGARALSVKGVEIPRGWCHSATGKGSWKRELEGPLTVLFGGPATDWSDVSRYLEEATAFARPILVIAPRLGPKVVEGLMLNDGPKSYAPGFVGVSLDYMMGGAAHEYLEDVAALSGARVILPHPGMPVDPTDFGSLHRAELTRSQTLLLGYEEPPDPERLEGRVRALLNRSDDRDRARGAALGGDLVRVEVGGLGDSDARRRMTLAEGALLSVSSAARSGVLPQGGAAALAALAAEPGPEWVREALRAPLQALGDRAGPGYPTGLGAARDAAEKALSAALEVLASSVLLARR
jgi:hypothetical protein